MNHHRTNNKSTMVKENCIITPCNIITKNVLYVYTRHKNHTYFHPLHPNPTYEWCREIYTFDKSYPGHPYYVLSFSDPCLALTQQPPAPGVMKFTTWVDLFLVILTIYSVCLIYISRRREEEIKHIHCMIYLATP